MDFLSTLRDARAGREAQEAARMQEVAALAKSQGAGEYAQGLANMMAEQKYMDATNPQMAVPATGLAGKAWSVDSRSTSTPQSDAWLAEIRARKGM